MTLKILGEGGGASVGFPGGSDGKESACSAGDLGWQDALEKEMATHSSIPAWRIPWTEEPGLYSPWGHKDSDTADSVCE